MAPGGRDAAGDMEGCPCWSFICIAACVWLLAWPGCAAVGKGGKDSGWAAGLPGDVATGSGTSSLKLKLPGRRVDMVGESGVAADGLLDGGSIVRGCCLLPVGFGGGAPAPATGAGLPGGPA
eukprot:CAMPEP_0177632452 /NCGR_PEP_ID=MMETSP0447-20121125/2298_1 /TAXON_ID=0 /ORGANISM="Stygamoeba regulata, Strain BSH-02190019" /LENGTH=121 /DNA_ID=CAMNT_0019134019 /DNA_START=419 /DNA_END=781 /DNA_ORIENTATION=-